MSLLVIYEILGLFVNTLTVDENYPLYNTENLPQPNQMQLTKKFFLRQFWKLDQILNIF